MTATETGSSGVAGGRITVTHPAIEKTVRARLPATEFFVISENSVSRSARVPAIRFEGEPIPRRPPVWTGDLRAGSRSDSRVVAADRPVLAGISQLLTEPQSEGRNDSLP